MACTHRWLLIGVAVNVAAGLSLLVQQAPPGVRIPMSSASASLASERPSGGLRMAAVAIPEPPPPTTPVALTTPPTTVQPHTHSAAHRRRPARQPRASRDNPSGPNQEIGRRLMLERWGEDQWPCLEGLWNRESGWREYASNPRSGAHGIPQSYPGHKMASHGADWRTNPETQIRWGLDYIQSRYGTPCKADQVQRRTRSY